MDLAQHASYSDVIGNRLLAAIGELSGLVGYPLQNCGMPGPAQRYFTFGLQAARESTDPRAPMLVVSILADMAQHMRWLGRPNTALRLHDLALSQLPTDRRRYLVVRAVLACKRAEDGLCYLGGSALSEVRSTAANSSPVNRGVNRQCRTHSPRGRYRRTGTRRSGLAGPPWTSALFLVSVMPRR